MRLENDKKLAAFITLVIILVIIIVACSYLVLAFDPPAPAALPESDDQASVDSPPTPETSAASPTAPETPAAFTTGTGYRPAHPYFAVPYSVDPSFSTIIPYDFSIYDMLPGYLNRLERCKDDIACIVNNVSVIEQENPDFEWIVKYGGNVISEDSAGLPEYPAWEAYCEKPDQQAVTSLAEAIDTCARSTDKNCICPYTLPIVTSEDIDRWYGRAFSFGLMYIPAIGPLLGLVSLAATELSEAKEWEERVIAFKRSGSDIKVSMRSPGKADPQIVSDARFNRVHPDLRGDSPLELKYTIDDAGKVVDVFKNYQGNISIYPQGQAPSSEQCGLHNKMVKFCVVQNKTFFAYNQQANRMGLQQLVLKFAYLFKSEVTDVRNFEVNDAVFASNTSLLVWDPVEGVDVNFYTVYYSEDPAMEANLRGKSPTEIEPEIKEKLGSIQLYVDSKQEISIAVESLFDPSCVVYGTACVRAYELETVIGEEVSDVMLDNGLLYYSTADSKLFYFLPDMKNKHHYFFAITATDMNGDESPSFNIPAKERYEDSRDDLPPGIATVKDAWIDADGKNVMIHIEPLDYNIDGSSLDPASITKLKIYCFESGVTGEFDLSEKEALHAKGIEQLDDGTVQFSRSLSDFTAFNCGFTSSPQLAKLVIAGVKTITGVDTDYRGTITDSSFSHLSITIPEPE